MAYQVVHGETGEPVVVSEHDSLDAAKEAAVALSESGAKRVHVRIPSDQPHEDQPGGGVTPVLGSSQEG